jgi:predicted dehydrogenase
MTSETRRAFLQTAAGTASVVSAASYQRIAMAAGSSQRPVIGFIGCGGRSASLLDGFAKSADVAWACDPDETRGRQFQQRSGASRFTTDLRHILDDQAVDAVVIATPDHWHAPAAIMACEAGKHVYVEKPCSHNLREGQLLVASARRNKIVVQHGTQSRSDRQIAGAVQMLREGIIGNVLMARAWNVQRRTSIGHVQPSDPPAAVDYDTWVGPAEFVPFQSNRFHYHWHWWHNFGTGDIGNDGTHEIDIARWGLGVDGLPSQAAAIGGKYYFQDDQQFPDTATCVFEWPGDGSTGRQKQLIFEMRIWSKNLPYNCDTGIEFHGTKGMLFVSKRGKLQVWDDSNRRIEDPEPREFVSTPSNHQVDFLEAIANNRSPTADIATGHDSAALVHLANISVRLGMSLQVDPRTETIIDNNRATAMLSRKYRDAAHWGIPRVL